MIGLALIGIGGIFIWAAFTGRADKVFAAMKMDLPHAVKYDPTASVTGVKNVDSIAKTPHA